MSIFSMGLSYGEHDFDKEESEVSLIDDSRESRQRGCDMDMHDHHLLHHHHDHVVEIDVEFWPVEHPMEPQDEDRPVKCPIPTSSIINDGRISEGRYAESLRKKAEVSAAEKKEGIVVVTAETEPPIRAVRKRQHTLTNGDHSIVPLTRMPPLPLPTQNVTIFQMLQQLDEFES